MRNKILINNSGHKYNDAYIIKQQLSNIWSSNREKLSNTDAELKKVLLTRKAW